jgi:hypothetical protein
MRTEVADVTTGRSAIALQTTKKPNFISASPVGKAETPEEYPQRYKLAG